MIAGSDIPPVWARRQASGITRAIGLRVDRQLIVGEVADAKVIIGGSGDRGPCEVDVAAEIWRT